MTVSDLGRREFLQQAAGAVALTQASPAAASRKPNILFVLSDQWRAQTLTTAGDPDIHAPNLKRLAEEGVQFDRNYVSYPLCCPSRASIVTGRFPQACGMADNRPIMPLGERTMAQELKKIGYATGYIGKWHLDGNPGPNFVPPGERRRGFDYWAAYSRGHRYYNSVYYRDTDEPIQMGGYEPDYQTDLAIEFIKRNKDNPFYLYVSWGPPHEMPGRINGRYAFDRTPPAKYANFYKPGQFHLRPNVPKDYEATARKGLAGYYGLCSALDDNIGRLLNALNETALADDTIVVFSSDHGDMVGSHGLEAKGVPYEESARAPLLIRYPRRIKAGRKDNLMISNVDYMPTLLTLCGAPVQKQVQGRDLSQQVLGGQGERPDSILSVCDLGSPREWRMVVRGQDKLVVDVLRRPTRLYNLSEDPFEMRNLVNDPAHAKKKAELHELLNNWILRVG